MRIVQPLPGSRLTVVRLRDRRRGAAFMRKEWLFQSELENYLYGNWQTKGSFYQLLVRSGVGSYSLCLRRKSVAEGVVTDEEFMAIRGVVGIHARVVTIVPLDAVAAALKMYGRAHHSEALARALHLDAFTTQTHGQEEEDEGEVDGQNSDMDEEPATDEEREGEEDAEDEQSENGDTDRQAAAGSSNAGSNAARSEDSSPGDACPDTEEEEDPPVIDDAPADRKAPRRSPYAMGSVPAELEAELHALEQWRVVPINMSRKSVAVAPITAATQRENVVRLLGWLEREKRTTRPGLHVFASPNIGRAVDLYVKFLVEEKRRKYTTIAGYLASFVAAARFVHAQRSKDLPPGAHLDTGPIDDLKSIHMQVLQQARRQATFDLASPPKETLDWSQVQRARCRAQQALAALTADSDATERKQATRDVAILMFLTHQPPDRVGVCRLLKLGSTLKRTPSGGFDLDLSQPGDHKTIAAFGPSCTTVPAAIANAFHAHVNLSEVPHGGYVFAAFDKPFEPLTSVQWTRLVQKIFKQHSGVALAPKDLRSSHVTWLRGDEHDDETLRSAALAMRHSSKTAASSSYDKQRSDRLVQKSMDVAAEFAARFRPDGVE